LLAPRTRHFPRTDDRDPEFFQHAI
jgi:hypothetical protein